MNWRGRPLTSHEVVVATIASTRTRTGLRVHAELDTGDYPLGHRRDPPAVGGRCRSRRMPEHGQWNYTIAPTGGQVAPVGTDERARARAAALQLLADERLTGMSRDALAALAQRCWPRHKKRKPPSAASNNAVDNAAGHRARAARGLLTDADRVLVTIVYLRQICSQNVLSELLGINPNTIGAGDRRDPPAAHRAPPHDRADHAAVHHGGRADRSSSLSGEPEPVRSRVSDQLAHPALTGHDPRRARRDDRPRQARPRRPQRTTPPPPPRRRTPARRPRRRVHPEDHRRRTGPRHRALPAQTVHPGHPRRTVRGQPPHHRRRRARSRPDPDPERLHPTTSRPEVPHRGGPARHHPDRRPTATRTH